jgi:hypothetical protein
MRPGAGLSRAALAVIAACASAACHTAPPRAAPAPVTDPSRFPHDRHAQLACGACHASRAVAAGQVRPPGSDNHAPCDRGACHRPAFTGPPGPLCRVCHESVDPTGAEPSPLRDYPPTDAWRAEPARFSHAVHLDRGKMEGAVGFHVACIDCHAPAGAYPGVGGHAECARCHATEVGLHGAPTMADCAGCHAVGVAERHPRRLIRGDLQFDHRRHQTDLRGRRIACETCHDATAFAKTPADHAPPPIAACVACHDDSDRVPVTLRMRICETCHTSRSESIGALAPRSHLPATEMPIDHTLAFRTDHGEAAAADPARCARCHTQMSGSRGSACDECHQTMKPRDHTVLWRDLDHGSEAAADAQRCATCHVADFCTSCHAQVPRSHLPLSDFRTHHGPQARINPRACVTCHDPVATCKPCHGGGVGTGL